MKIFLLTAQKATVVLVYGVFADASSWNGVVEKLQEHEYRVAASSPLRGLTSDSDHVEHLVASIDGPIVLTGNSDSGAAIGSTARSLDKIQVHALVAAFMPGEGESAVESTGEHHGSTPGDVLRSASAPKPPSWRKPPPTRSACRTPATSRARPTRRRGRCSSHRAKSTGTTGGQPTVIGYPVRLPQALHFGWTVSLGKAFVSQEISFARPGVAACRGRNTSVSGSLLRRAPAFERRLTCSTNQRSSGCRQWRS